MQQEQYFKAVPVSEKMERSNQLFCIDRYGFKSVRSNLYKPLSPNVTHYLEPIPLPDAAVLRSALEKCLPYMEEMEKDNTHDPGVGLQYDHDLGNAVKAALEALSAGDGWIRIDSGNLPELGKLVWLGWDKYPDRKEVDPEPGRMIDGKPWLEEGVNVWVNNVNGWRHVFEPTHWKPYILPSPPKK